MKPDNRERANLKDVAIAAHTSVATVSRVLNNSGYYSDEIRSRVQKAAEILNYQPNLHAKSLRKRRSHTVGLLIPNLLNAYYTALADDVSQLLNAHGYQLLLSSTRDNPVVEKNAFLQLIGHNVDGLIWAPSAADKNLLDTLSNRRIPAVAIVRKVEDNRLPTIVFEDYAGAHAATSHLLQLNHTRIGLIGGDVKYSSNHDRMQGYVKALEAASIQVDWELVKMGEMNAETGSASAEALLQLPQPPTAIFVASNALMPGVMKTIRRHELNIPEEISLICFDDLEWFLFSKPPISAIASNHTNFAKAAVDLLLNYIQNPGEMDKPPLLIKVSFELLLRGSTTPPRRV